MLNLELFKTQLQMSKKCHERLHVKPFKCKICML